MQPPVSIMTMVEHAMAFMWLMGSGVINRSAPARTSQRPPTLAYHVPARRKYSLVSTQPLGLPVVPDV